MTYTSYYFGNNEKRIYKTGISEEEYSNILANIEYLREIMNEIDYCMIVRDNIYDFLSDAEKNGIGEDKSFIRLNRYMMNWLNSFYVWIEYHEKNHHDIFSVLKQKYYDEYFEYRFAYEMRRYTTHQRMCISRIKVDILNEKTYFIIDSEDVLKHGKMIKASVRKELENLINRHENVEAVTFVRNSLVMFERLQGEIWSTLSSDISTKIQYIMKFIKNDGLTIHESWIVSDDNTIINSIDFFLKSLFNKLNNIMVPDYLKQYL